MTPVSVLDPCPSAPDEGRHDLDPRGRRCAYCGRRAEDPRTWWALIRCEVREVTADWAPRNHGDFMLGAVITKYHRASWGPWYHYIRCEHGFRSTNDCCVDCMHGYMRTDVSDPAVTWTSDLRVRRRLAGTAETWELGRALITLGLSFPECSRRTQ